jgi:hypothetical protein
VFTANLSTGNDVSTSGGLGSFAFSTAVLRFGLVGGLLCYLDNGVLGVLSSTKVVSMVMRVLAS